MPEQNFTAKYKVDVSELKSGIAEANKSIKLANAQFNEASSSMDDWTKSSDGLNAKLKQLNTVLDAQKSKLLNYEKQLEEVQSAKSQSVKRAKELEKALQDLESNGVSKTSKEYLDLKKQLTDTNREIASNEKSIDSLEVTIANQNATINKAQREINKYSKELDDLGKESDNAGDGLDDLARETKKYEKSADDAENSTKDLNEGFTTMKGVVANLISTGISKLVSSIAGAVEETREYRRELAYLEQNAKTAGASFENVKKNLSEVTAITDDTGAGIEGLSNLVASGFDGKQLDKITEQLLGASIKWKDTLKFEGLSDGLQETLATGGATGPFAEMLERSGVSLEKFDAGLAKCSTSAKKQQYVLQQLNKLGLSEITKGYEESNKGAIASAKANFELNDNIATLAEKAEPAITAVKQGFADLLGALIKIVKDVDMEEFANGISNGFKFFIDNILPPVIEFFKFIAENGNTILGIITSIGAGFAVFKIVGMITTAVTAFKTFTSALSAGKTVMEALNLTMSLNPIGLIVSAIAVAVSAFLYFWNTSEEFRNFWIGLWDGIVSAFNETVSFLGDLFSNIGQFFHNLIKNAGDFVVGVIKKFIEFRMKVIETFMNILSSIIGFFANLISTGISKTVEFVTNVVKFFAQLPFKIGQSLGNVIRSIISWGSDMVSKGAKFATDFVSNIVKTVTQLPSKMISIGKDIVKGLWNGISDMVGWITGKIKGFGDSVLGGIKDFFGIHSPSRVFRDEIGKMLAKGIGVGFDDEMPSVNKDIVNSLEVPTIQNKPLNVPGLNNSQSKSNNGGGDIYITQNITNPKTSNYEVYRATRNASQLLKKPKTA